MKFGKSYMETLASPSFPEDWRRGAIEYKQLKKVINDVVAELESLGLSASVLSELLAQQQRKKDEHNNSQPASPNTFKATRKRSQKKYAQAPSSSAKAAPTPSGYSSSSGRPSPADTAAPGTAANPLHPTEIVPPAAKSPPNTAKDWLERVPHLAHKRKSESEGSNETSRERGSAAEGSEKDDSMSEYPTPLNAFLGSDQATTESEVEYIVPGNGNWVEGTGGRRAQAKYELGGTAQHPIPRIRIIIESPVTSSASDDGSDAEDQSALPAGPDSPDTFKLPRSAYKEPGTGEGVPFFSAALQADREADAEADWEGDSEGGEDDGEVDTRKASPVMFKPSDVPIAASASKETLRSAGHYEHGKGKMADDQTPRPSPYASPITPFTTHTSPSLPKDDDKEVMLQGTDIHAPGVFEEFSTDQDEDIQQLRALAARHKRRAAHRRGRPRRMRSRQMTIPLVADKLFLDLLTSALVAVRSVQALQRKEFVASTERLTKAIGEASSPYGKQTDLYAWREIFQIWAEAQIFESTREKDAGELDPEVSEERLVKFANELYKRGWLQGSITPSRLDTKETLGGHGHLSTNKIPTPSSVPTEGRHESKLSPQSAQALQDFLELNVALLDVKKYQRMNLEAARKILKKHDKRTSLTAGQDLREFMAREQVDTRSLQEDLQVLKVTPPTDPMDIANALAAGEVELDHKRLRRVLKNPWKKSSSASTSNVPLPHVHPPSLSGEGTSKAVVPVQASVPSLEALLPLQGKDGLMLGGGESESLAHILFSLMNSQLMPILPAVSDYECLICTSVAWRPIRLDCGHLFCIRCLVKLQKMGRRACPLCRAPDVVATAGERNLDATTTNMLKVWFPREVREKEKENDRDRKAEEMKELGLEDKCLVM